MTKKVKITVTGLPITTISSPLTMGTHGPVILDTNDIFKCIVAGAKVVEVFDGYGEVVLTLSNYNSDNIPYIKAAVVKSTIDEIKASTDYVDEPQPVPDEPIVTTEEAVVGAEDTTDDTSDETPTEESQVEEPKSPEHWMPPQRGNNQGKNNNKNNGNKGKRK